MRIAVDNSLNDLPILVLGIAYGPAIQVDSVEQLQKPFRYYLI
jgi:hypothetical protein